MFDKKIFQSHVREFLIDSLAICEKNSGKLDIDEIKSPIFFSNGKYKKYEIIKTPDYDFFIRNSLKKDIQKLHSFQIIKKLLVTKEIQDYNRKLLGDVHENFSVKPNFAEDLPLKFLVVYLIKNKNFNFNKKNYQNSFDKFNKFLNNTLEDEYVSPLFNFESDINNTSIDINGIKIRRLTNFEFYKFVNLDENSNISNVYHNLTHVMEIKFTTSNLDSGHKVVKEKFKNLINSLSLFNNGNPQFGTIFRNINNPWFHFDSSNEKNINKLENLKFKKRDKNKVVIISKLINEIDFLKKENKFLDIAISRFTNALTRTDKVDQFIDLMISLEALFAPGNKGEITTKLSTRLATLIAKNEKQREDYWLFIKKMYNLRSGIIHGEGFRSTEINGVKYEIDECLEKIIELTRESILQLLKLSISYSGNNKISKICDDIDSAMINKKNLQKLRLKLR
jgi:hypothetical protein